MFREFLRTLVRDLVELERLCGEALEESLARGEPRLSLAELGAAVRASGFRQRSKDRKAAVLGHLAEQLNRNLVEGAFLLTLLHELRELYVRLFFCSDPASPESRDILCHRDPELEPSPLLAAMEESATAPIARRPKADTPAFEPPGLPPGMGRYLDDRHPEVESVEAAMRGADKGRDRSLLRVLSWVRRKGGGAYDFTGWLPGKETWPWALSDLLIVLSAPRGAIVASKDRAFSVLCAVLGRRLVTVAQLREEGARARPLSSDFQEAVGQLEKSISMLRGALS